MFRTDDSRVGPMALFSASGDCSLSGAYSGNGGGEYEYTLGSGAEIPDGGGTQCTDPSGNPCIGDPYHPDYVPGCVCQ
jgi:hypothetical protein